MTFEKRFEKLNSNQQKAVETIFGPLLVIAGPGTGKTELLSMRAAQILKKTDTLPSNILCLTFTESGATNMRERLRSIIGEDAYKIAIHTFHGFGTEIINQNRQYFFRGSDMKPTDDLTRHQIMQEIFASLDWKNPLLVKNNDNFIYLADVLKVISEFKQSGLTPDELSQILDDNQNTIDNIVPDITRIFSSRVSKSTIDEFAPLAQKVASLQSGQLPNAITPYHQALALSIVHASQEAIDTNSTKPITLWKNNWCEKDAHGNQTLKDKISADKLRHTIDVYEKYQQALEVKQLFDYDDMILSVLQSVEDHPALAANLKEHYQFIMVDEFQDTNLAQLRLLFNLTESVDQPNIMAVGDDDQAIFSFQGADIGNIHRFREYYADPNIIVLTDNYRSTDKILSSARGVITQGADRLENTISGISKVLTTHASYDKSNVSVHEYSSPLNERAGVANQVSNLIEAGAKPEDIAIIARQHNELIDLLPYLTSHRIAVNYERYDDVLEQPLVQVLELVARTVLAIHDGDHDQANVLLRDLVAHPSLGFEPSDIWNLSLQAWRNRSLWLETMLSQPALAEFANWLITQSHRVKSSRLEQQIDDLLDLHRLDVTSTEPAEYSPGIAMYFFSSDYLSNNPENYLVALESLRTLRDNLREHYQTEEPDLSQLLEFIDLHRSTKTRLVTVRSRSETRQGAINLMSAHKAKGLEFPYVFIIGAIDKTWGERVRGRSRLIRYPANLPLAPAGNNYDERLRLFFVAMTRAKSTLDISYSRSDSNGKDSLIASFLSDYTPLVAPDTPDVASQIDILLTDWRSRLTDPITGSLRSVLAPVLESYKLSVTHLNNFLDVSRGGPQTFLRNNLLRFPQTKTASADYGTAIHDALQFAHNSFAIDGNLPETTEIVSQFLTKLKNLGLTAEDLNRYSQQGQLAIETFFAEKGSSFTKTQLAELNFAGQSVVVGEAKLTGKLDLVDIDKQQKTIFVTDYKTGKPSRDWSGRTDYEKIKLHKYRQQLMFYQLLARNSRDYSSYEFLGGSLQFVEPDQQTGELLALEDTFTEEELDKFSRLIAVVWQKITTLDLPDVSSYTLDYKGMTQFEADLVDER